MNEPLFLLKGEESRRLWPQLFEGKGKEPLAYTNRMTAYCQLLSQALGFNALPFGAMGVSPHLFVFYSSLRSHPEVYIYAIVPVSPHLLFRDKKHDVFAWFIIDNHEGALGQKAGGVIEFVLDQASYPICRRRLGLYETAKTVCVVSGESKARYRCHYNRTRHSLIDIKPTHMQSWDWSKALGLNSVHDDIFWLTGGDEMQKITSSGKGKRPFIRPCSWWASSERGIVRGDTFWDSMGFHCVTEVRENGVCQITSEDGAYDYRDAVCVESEMIANKRGHSVF